MQIWHSVRGFVAGGLAFIVCPCHLPLTLPILLGLTAGTAVGGWLANNTVFIYVAAAVLFIGGLALAGRWLISEQSPSCPIEQKELTHEQV